MLDWRQVAGGPELLADVDRLRTSMDGHRVTTSGGLSLADELALLCMRVQLIRGDAPGQAGGGDDQA